MNYYKFLGLLLLVCLVSCSSGDDEDFSPPLISITGFETSKNKVELSWSIDKGKNIIIEDLVIKRASEDSDFRFNFKDETTNLPSTALSFTDKDIPYWDNLTYQIILNYREQDDSSYSITRVESEVKVFLRSFPKFERVPFQVLKNSDNTNTFHILEKSDNARLSRYVFDEDIITHSFDVSDNYKYYNSFIYHNNQLVIADLEGNVYFLNTNNYDVIKQYKAEVTDGFGSYGIIEDRLYFLDDFRFNYIELENGNTVKHGTGKGFMHFEVIDDSKLLTLYSGPWSSSASIYEFENDLDPGSGWDFSLSRTIDADHLQLDGDDIDQYNKAWNNDKTRFISGIDGHLFNLSDLSLEVVLSNKTGKKYLGYAFNNNGDIYCTVQKAKEIHVFDGDTYELKNTILTKLNPIFPLVTETGLKCIGAYDKIEYWGYNYGYDYGFNSKCAIENFEVL